MNHVEVRLERMEQKIAVQYTTDNFDFTDPLVQKSRATMPSDTLEVAVHANEDVAVSQKITAVIRSSEARLGSFAS